MGDVEEETVLTGVKFMQYTLSGYKALIDEIIGAAKDERDESNVEKLHQKIREFTDSTGRIKHRKLYRALHVNRKEYDSLLEHVNYKIDKDYLYPLPVTV